MYVKVNQGHEGEDFLLETHGPLTSGFKYFDLDEVSEHPDWIGMVGIPHGTAMVLDVLPQNFNGQEKYRVRYVWWPRNDGLGPFSGVVTSRNIFIVGDDGQTVDRVR